MLVEVSLVALSSACFEFADKSQKEFSTAILQSFRSFDSAIFTAFRRLLLWGFARIYFLAFSLCWHAPFISASTRGLAHYLTFGTDLREVRTFAIIRDCDPILMPLNGTGGH